MNQDHCTPQALDIASLESVYDQLATALDAVGGHRCELFLTKLVLLAANELGSAQRFAELLQAARRDL